MKSTIALMFDTSALRTLGWTSSAFSSVLQLAKAGHIEIYLPELVIAERRSHWVEGPSKAIRAAESALKSLAENAIIRSHHADQVTRLLNELHELDVEELATSALDGFIHDNRINVVEMTLEHPKAAWKAYFAGRAPHREPKLAKTSQMLTSLRALRSC